MRAEQISEFGRIERKGQRNKVGKNPKVGAYGIRPGRMGRPPRGLRATLVHP